MDTTVETNSKYVDQSNKYGHVSCWNAQKLEFGDGDFDY